jgi:hypothetical protein
MFAFVPSGPEGSNMPAGVNIRHQACRTNDPTLLRFAAAGSSSGSCGGRQPVATRSSSETSSK